MLKGISRELRQEIRRVLGEEINRSPESNPLGRGLLQEPLTKQAIEYLIDVGAFEPHRLPQALSVEVIRVTAIGREYWDRINTPAPIYWFRQNKDKLIWSALTAVISIAVAAILDFVM